MWVIKENIKIIFFRIIFKFFWLFPLKDQIFFSSYEGKQISGNPKILFENMINLEEFKKYLFVWESNKSEINGFNKKSVVYVKHNSLSYIFNILTSRILITNSGLNPIFPLRKKQIYINTWHGGGAYKRVGTAVNQKINGSSYYSLKVSSKQTTYLLSSSKMFSNIMSESIMIEKNKILPYGMPRNDIFFDHLKVKYYYEITRKILKIDKNIKIILYAPTFRSNDQYDNIERLDLSKMIQNLEKKFGNKWVFLYRGHYHSKDSLNKKNCVDVSNYPEMQELLCAADILVTDYSSSIWDFSFLKRPCFLYVPDLKKYEKERNFYTDIEEWPGIIINNNNEIPKVISNFNYEIFLDKIISHHKKLINYENGTASTRLINLLRKIGDDKY